MNNQEIHRLLMLAHGHDQRHETNEVKVLAWKSIIDQEAPDMEYGWAAKKINEHYAKLADMLMPVHLIASWKEHKRFASEAHLAGERGPVRTGMPEWFKAALHDTKSGAFKIGEAFRIANELAPRAADVFGGSDAHCGRTECRCTHRDCYRGWHGTDTAIPCYQCRPELVEALGSIPPAGQRSSSEMGLLSRRNK